MEGKDEGRWKGGVKEGKDGGRCEEKVVEGWRKVEGKEGGRVGGVRMKGGEEEEGTKVREVFLEEEFEGDDEASQHFIVAATRRDTCLQMITLYSFHPTALRMLAASTQID